MAGDDTGGVGSCVELEWDDDGESAGEEHGDQTPVGEPAPAAGARSAGGPPSDTPSVLPRGAPPPPATAAGAEAAARRVAASRGEQEPWNDTSGVAVNARGAIAVARAAAKQAAAGGDINGGGQPAGFVLGGSGRIVKVEGGGGAGDTGGGARGEAAAAGTRGGAAGVGGGGVMTAGGKRSRGVWLQVRGTSAHTHTPARLYDPGSSPSELRPFSYCHDDPGQRAYPWRAVPGELRAPTGSMPPSGIIRSPLPQCTPPPRIPFVLPALQPTTLPLPTARTPPWYSSRRIRNPTPPVSLPCCIPSIFPLYSVRRPSSPLVFCQTRSVPSSDPREDLTLDQLLDAYAKSRRVQQETEARRKENQAHAPRRQKQAEAGRQDAGPAGGVKREAAPRRDETAADVASRLCPKGPRESLAGQAAGGGAGRAAGGLAGGAAAGGGVAQGEARRKETAPASRGDAAARSGAGHRPQLNGGHGPVLSAFARAFGTIEANSVEGRQARAQSTHPSHTHSLPTPNEDVAALMSPAQARLTCPTPLAPALPAPSLSPPLA